MLSSVCSKSEALQIPIHFALTRLKLGVCVARCRAGDGPADVPDVWLLVVRGAASQVRALVTDLSDSHAAIDSWASANSSRWISHAPHHVPQRVLPTADASVPPYLDTHNCHQWWRPEIIATFSSCRGRW